MRISFVLNTVATAGGVRVVLETANSLAARGHEVTVVTPLAADIGAGHTVRQSIRYFKRRVLDQSIRPMVNGNFRLKFVPDLSWDRFIPDGDAIFATWWETAEHVAAYPKRTGSKFYLVQHYEIWGGPRERVEATYRLALHQIVYAQWLKDLLSSDFDRKDVSMITFGVNRDQFFYEPGPQPRDRRVGMMYSAVNWKGSRDGIEAFQMARKRFPGIQLVLFGCSYPGLEVPSDAEFHYDPPQASLRSIYSSCAIWLSSSWYETGPIPPFEAMACRCAVAATATGMIADVGTDGKTVLLSPPFDPAMLGENLIRLLADPSLRDRIAQSGYESTRDLTWEKTAEQVETIILSEKGRP